VSGIHSPFTLHVQLASDPDAKAWGSASNRETDHNPRRTPAATTLRFSSREGAAIPKLFPISASKKNPNEELFGLINYDLKKR
jgi:hypothetical protein